MSNNEITNLWPLATLTRLTDLNLDANIINDLSPLLDLIDLEMLALNNNEISDLGSLSSLVNLDILMLGDNEINDLTSLSELTNLSRLVLTDNETSDLAPLSSLTNLDSLDLRHNEISDLTPLPSLTYLNTLALSGNQINNFTPLAEIQYLRDFFIFYDDLRGLDESDLISLIDSANFWQLILEDDGFDEVDMASICAVLEETERVVSVNFRDQGESINCESHHDFNWSLILLIGVGSGIVIFVTIAKRKKVTMHKM